MLIREGNTVMAMACAGSLVDEDGHELILGVPLGTASQLARPICAQEGSQIQLQRER